MPDDFTASSDFAYRDDPLQGWTIFLSSGALVLGMAAALGEEKGSRALGARG